MHYKIGFQEQNALAACCLRDFVYKLVGFWPDHSFSPQASQRGQDFLDGLLSYFFKQKKNQFWYIVLTTSLVTT